MDWLVSIHAFRGEGDVGGWRVLPAVYGVSIHAFRGEGDTAVARVIYQRDGFNPRLPGGRRPASLGAALIDGISFNPRLPGGRRHTARFLIYKYEQSFNPRLPGGRRLRGCVGEIARSGVSIHAFRGEGDLRRRDQRFNRGLFQSTPSGGKATARTDGRSRPAAGFNPRLPGGRRLRVASFVVGMRRCFNPRLPGGRRLPHRQHAGLALPGFNPRLPGGRRRAVFRRTMRARAVSIHAFRGEGDRETRAGRVHPPRVSIHAFRGEGDVRLTTGVVDAGLVSIHAFRGEGDTSTSSGITTETWFQSTPSGGKATSPRRTS